MMLVVGTYSPPTRFFTTLWQPKVFKDLDHLRSESKKFRDKHNNYQEYRKSTFSKQKSKSYETRYLPITRGRLHFVRMVKENGNINILNEDFYVDNNLSFEYVWAIISTKDRNVKIWYQPTKDAPKELLKAESYELRELVKNKIPMKQFC